MPDWEIRQTTASDRGTVDRLLSAADHRHLHLDWLDPTDLAGRQPFLLAIEGRHPVACLASPPDAPGVAWVRAFAVSRDQPVQRGWDRLWPLARQQLLDQGIDRAAAMALDAWFGKLLSASGFSQTNAVVFLELELSGSQPKTEASEPAAGGGITAAESGPQEAQNQPAAADRGWKGNGSRPSMPGAAWRSRPITAADQRAVLELDAAAFEPMWRLSIEAMQAALSQASSATLIEIDASVVGYQITTSSPFSVHLARLAVHPEWQRRGLGRALVGDSIETAAAQPLGRISVNTQADNYASLALYQQLGFKQTGQQFPVYTTGLARRSGPAARQARGSGDRKSTG